MTAHEHNLYFLPSGTVKEFNVVIEIPYGSQNKYEIDPKTGALMLDKTLIKCRAVGLIKKVDGGDRDSCIIGVPLEDPRFDDMQDVNDVPKHRKKEFIDFFNTYKRLQNKVSEVEGIFDKAEAEAEIARYLNNYPTIDTEVKFN